MKTNGKKTVANQEPAIETSNRIRGARLEFASDGQRFRAWALAGLTIVLFALCVWLAMPFLSALAWGIAFAIIAWPLHVWLRRHLGNPKIAAIATTFAVLLVIVLPGLFVVYQIVGEANSAAEQMKTDDAGATVRARLAAIPSMQGVVAWIDSHQIDIDAELRRWILSYVNEPSKLLGGSIAAILQFALALFILFHFLKDGPILREQVQRLLPMSRSDCDRVFSSVSDSVHANIYATVLTGLIDGITGGLLFWAVGLPSPALWGAVIFVVSVVPVLGSFVVWAPAAFYLIITSQVPEALIVIAWGVLTAIFVDTLLYIRLAGKRMKLHQVPSMLAFLGGLVLFGPAGMVLGPAILAVTVAVLDVWRRRPTSDPGQTMLAAPVRS